MIGTVQTGWEGGPLAGVSKEGLFEEVALCCARNVKTLVRGPDWYKGSS